MDTTVRREPIDWSAWNRARAAREAAQMGVWAAERALASAHERLREEQQRLEEIVRAD